MSKLYYLGQPNITKYIYPYQIVDASLLRVIRILSLNVHHRLTSTMTVSTPPFVFPPTSSTSANDDHRDPPFTSSGQWQYGNRAERPHLDTESSSYGTYVR